MLYFSEWEVKGPFIGNIVKQMEQNQYSKAYLRKLFTAIKRHLWHKDSLYGIQKEMYILDIL